MKYRIIKIAHNNATMYEPQWFEDGKKGEGKWVKMFPRKSEVEAEEAIQLLHKMLVKTTPKIEVVKEFELPLSN